MLQVESGNFKAVDFDNFDEFFCSPPISVC